MTMFSMKLLVIAIAIFVDTVSGAPSEIGCPPEEDIFPCSCTLDFFLRANLDCSLILNEEELANIFSHEFQDNHFFALRIDFNLGLRSLSQGVFGNVTFSEISINYSILEAVEPGALLGSAATLITIQMQYNKLVSFPFKEISSYERLENFYMGNNDLKEFPILTSMTLKELSLPNNPVGNLPVNALHGLPAIETIYLYSCNITEVLPGTFAGPNNLFYITLADNNISQIQPHSFELHGRNARLYLTSNNISAVANDSIIGVSYFTNISENKLEILEEGAWRHVLEEGSLLGFEENPLACGCDVAWLIRSKTLMTYVYGDPKCSNGIPVRQLDPDDYEIC